MAEQIKKSISALCKHLNFLYNIELKPEYFRLAKFNKSENNIIPMFWNVLSKFCPDIKTSNVVKNTKLYLLKQEYESIEFFGLSETMTDGSRELLLALGFLIATGSLHNAVNAEICTSIFGSNHKEYNYSSYSQQFHVNDFLINTKEDLDNIQKWISGKIRHNQRSIEDFRLCLDKIQKQITDYLPKIKDNYSITEILALKKPEFADKFLSDTERIMNILKNHEAWLKNEQIFWEWMDTVLIEREKDKSEINPSDLRSFLNFAKKIT